MNLTEIDKVALEFHAEFPAGKTGIVATKDVVKNISLAYSPGVAAPCIEISLDPNAAKKYTNIKNSIAIISNGTAVLGLGKLGALASKPVMEGKSALFKVLAGIDCIDLEIEERDPAKLVECIAGVATTFGGINLEDISAPECFVVESELKSRLSIPIFHDDQHGTAIVVAAAFINWGKLNQKTIAEVKVVCLGAGAAGIACAKMLKTLGVSNIYMFDSKGVIHKGREDINEHKSEFAAETDISMEEAMKDADVFVGTSVGNALKADLVKGMAKNPLILALANPIPEIYPEEAYAVREDAIVCTGRSDFDNQVNNVLCFPYIFRVALDNEIPIDDHLKLTTANSIADLARLSTEFGPKRLMPKPDDESLKYLIPGLIMSNLASETNLHEYSRACARRLLPHSHKVFHMLPDAMMQYLKLDHAPEFAQKNFQIEAILHAWGYSAAQLRTLASVSARDHLNALHIFVVDGEYFLTYNGSSTNNILNILIEKLNVKLCVPTNSTSINIKNSLGLIENYDSNPTCYYNPENSVDELALFSIICSNIFNNAIS